MKTISTLIALCIALGMVACEPEFDFFREFVIKKGEHYATGRSAESLQSHVLSFDAKFDKTAIYTFEDQAFQDSKNKLLGFADCNSLHHENSARFAWQWYNNQLEIYAYCYVNGERKEKFVGVVELDEVNHYEITILENEYSFQLNDQAPVSIERINKCTAGLYYMLWPYFGGSLPAPHNITIKVKINY